MEDFNHAVLADYPTVDNELHTNGHKKAYGTRERLK